jgi:hypothetical protein
MVRSSCLTTTDEKRVVAQVRRMSIETCGLLEELEKTVKYIYARVVKWLGRRGLLRDVDASNEAPTYSPREALTLAGMQRGTLETTKESKVLSDSYTSPSCCLANGCYQASSSEIALASILNSSLPRLHRHPRCQA